MNYDEIKTLKEFRFYLHLKNLSYLIRQAVEEKK